MKAPSRWLLISWTILLVLWFAILVGWGIRLATL